MKLIQWGTSVIKQVFPVQTEHRTDVIHFFVAPLAANPSILLVVVHKIKIKITCQRALVGHGWKLGKCQACTTDVKLCHSFKVIFSAVSSSIFEIEVFSFFFFFEKNWWFVLYRRTLNLTANWQKMSEEAFFSLPVFYCFTTFYRKWTGPESPRNVLLGHTENLFSFVSFYAVVS